jgi:glycosyltransferase involved in cell wall biosynthesis
MKKDVLFIVENLSFPFDRRVYRESLSLKQNGYNVTVISPKGVERDKKSYEIFRGIHIYRFPLFVQSKNKFDYLLEYLFSFIFIFFLSLKVLIERNFHVIHIANPPDIFFPILFFYRIIGKKIIFDQHDLTPESYLSRFRDERKDFYYKVQILFEFLTYKVSDYIIVTNRSYLQIAKKRGGKNKNIVIVRNGPQKKFFDYKGNFPYLKENFKYLVVYIGIMGIQDGVDYLIRSIGHFVNVLGRSDTLFVLIGKGDDFENLKNMVKEFKIDKYVKFTGRISDEEALKYLSTADVAVSPDPKNPLNDLSTMNKVMEYMITKSPIVSYDLKEAKYSAGESALYVENNDYKIFAEKISYLLDNEPERKKMVEIGYQRVVEHLCWEKQENNLLDLYKRIKI